VSVSGPDLPPGDAEGRGPRVEGVRDRGPPAEGPAEGQPGGSQRRARAFNAADILLGVLTRGAAIGILVMLVLLLGVLFKASLPAIERFGAGFLVGTEWRANALEQPRRDAAGKLVFEDGSVVVDTIEPVFGALPVIYGTAISALIAMMIAVPLSVGAALFIVRVAPKLKIAGPVSFLIEFLASIPSIAYGIWGLFVLAPFLQRHLEPFLQRTLGKVPGFDWMFIQTVNGVERPMALTGRDMLCGGLILAIMILPVITAISRDVLKSVPRGQVEGTQALGATWWQTSWAMIVYAKSGLFGAFMLGLARAAGETMAVAMVIGNNNQIEPSPFAPAQTMASLLANEFAEASDTLHRSALLYVAMILLVMSLVFNVVARWLVLGKESRSSEQ
jgi:phosphate transport system permease protein